MATAIRGVEVPSLKYLSDEELMGIYVSGANAQKAFETLYERYKGKLYRFAYAKLDDNDISEDLIQEAFLRVFRHAYRFDHSQSKFQTWLFTIMGNLIRNEIRNRKRRPILSASVVNAATDGIGVDYFDQVAVEKLESQPDAIVAQKELQKTVRGAMELIPPRYKNMLELRYFEDVTYEGISQRTGAKMGTVKSSLNRAKASLAERMRERL